jgi:hypothetical protein
MKKRKRKRRRKKKKKKKKKMMMMMMMMMMKMKMKMKRILEKIQEMKRENYLPRHHPLLVLCNRFANRMLSKMG